MLEYLRERNQKEDPILKFHFKKEVDEYLIAKDMLHLFNGSCPSKVSSYISNFLGNIIEQSHCWSN